MTRAIMIRIMLMYLAKNIQGLTITFVIVNYKLDEPILDTPRIILFTATSKRTKNQKAEVTSN